MVKEKSIAELKDQLGVCAEERKSILDKIKAESRKATDEETRKLGEIASRQSGLEFEIKLAEARNKYTGSVVNQKPANNLLIRSIRETVNNRVISDDVNALFEAGERSMRSAGVATTGGLIIPMEYRGDVVKATVASDGKEIVTEDMLDIIGPIRDKLVLVEAGATYMTGLVGNVGLPYYSGSNAAWAEETAAASNGKGSFSKKTLTPKRLTTYIDVSKQFLAQDSVMANNLLMSDLATAVAVKLQQTVFGKHSSAATMPDGFFTGSPTYVCSGNATFGSIVDLESAVDADNALAENMAYIMGGKARGILKKTLRAASVAEGFIYEGGMVNGYKTFTTASMASGLQTGTDEYGIVFGNWADLIIGQWGGLEITVDNLTQATNGAIRLVVNGYFDVVKRRDTSFAVGSLK